MFSQGTVIVLPASIISTTLIGARFISQIVLNSISYVGMYEPGLIGLDKI